MAAREREREKEQAHIDRDTGPQNDVQMRGNLTGFYVILMDCVELNEKYSHFYH